ncbi:putative RNA-directed DNA polymerase [Tanacetum coccineum]
MNNDQEIGRDRDSIVAHEDAEPTIEDTLVDETKPVVDTKFFSDEFSEYNSAMEVNVGGDINSLSAEHVSKEDLMGPIGNTGFASPHTTTKNVLDNSAQPSNVNKPNISSKLIHTGPFPNPKLPMDQANKNVQDDVELDEIVSSFKKLSQAAFDSKQKTTTKRKKRMRKRNLDIGGAFNLQPWLLGDFVHGVFLFSMKALSLNCNGLGSDDKKNWIRDLIKLESPSFLGIQESKLNYVDGLLMHSLWILVFSPWNISLKQVLWNSIKGIINSTPAACWIFFGDFNVVRIDKSGYKLSKLDQFLVTQNFFNIWSDVSVKVLSRSFSDHCPLVLTVGLPNFGPKAFKFFDKWIGNPKFQSVVSNLWSSGVYSLTPDLNLNNKIKKLRLDIKKWTSDTLHSQNQVKDNLLSNLADWERKAEAGTLLESDIIKREEWILDLHFFYQLEREYLKQKSRVKSAVKGDENTRYFHSLLRNHFASFSIKGIHVNGIWCENPALIKEFALDHFASRFKESPEARPKFRSTLFCRLYPENASFLDSSFSVEEVKLAIWSYSGSKAEGPDGFNFNFIKAY